MATRDTRAIAKQAIASTLLSTGEPFKFANDDPDESPELDPALTGEIKNRINRVLVFLGFGKCESSDIAKGLM